MQNYYIIYHIQQIFMPIVENYANSLGKTKEILSLFDESRLIKIIIKIMGNEISFFKHFTNVTFRFNDVDVSNLSVYGFPTVNTVKESALPRALKFLTR